MLVIPCSGILAIPNRDAMTPPKLTRYAPVLDVVHPLEEHFLLKFRDESDMAVLDGPNCWLS
jgi:hypothetical protein